MSRRWRSRGWIRTGASTSPAGPEPSGRCARTSPHSPHGACASASSAASSRRRPRRPCSAIASPHRSSWRRSPTSAWRIRMGRRALPGLRRPSARRSASRRSQPRAPLRSRLQRPPRTRFLQVYVFRDHGVTDELIAEAIDAGFSAVFLTVDLPVVGPRDRERRIHWSFDDGTLPAVRPAARRGHDRRGARPPRPGARLGLPGAACLVASRACRRQGDPRSRGCRPRCRPRRRRASSSRTTAAASSTARCRRSRRCRPSSTRSATGSRCSSTAGSGAAPTWRRRSPSARRAVLAGRMPLWGLAAGGEEGARQVLELLREELAIALHLTGCRSVADLSAASLVRRAPARP